MRWLTYFPEIHNVHLTKDLGLIPFFIQEAVGWEAKLVARFPEASYPSLKTEVDGLKIEILDDSGTFFFAEKEVLHYIEDHASQIDVLNLYHLSRHTLIYGVVYKKHNPNGKIYLKLDGYNSQLKHRKRYAKSAWKNVLLKRAERRFFKAVDLISIENRKGLAIARKTYPRLKNKLIYLPNGCNDLYLDKHFEQPFTKKNIILSVGRPGSPDKNYELVLAAISMVELDGWQMEIIGPMTEIFSAYWEVVQSKYPVITKKVKFLGEVVDRQKLYQKYSEAKVFFLPSHVESFGISYAEALYFGCILVGHSGMSAYDDLSANGKFGTYYRDNDPASFAKALKAACNKSGEPGMADEISAHSKQHFQWSGIVNNLKNRLENA